MTSGRVAAGVVSGRRRWMRWGPVAQVAGAAVGLSGVAMLAADVVAAIYREWRDVELIGLAALLTMVAGFGVWYRFRLARDLTVVGAFGAVGLTWVAMAAFGALPFFLTGAIPGFSDAFFESSSGFTATGSTVALDPSLLSHGVLFWRAETHWLGGMGVILLAVALLPLIGVSAVQLATAEAPGPIPERVTPRFQSTALRLWLVYAGFTVLQTVLLTVHDMTLFEAITHTFATISGGGFGTRADSLASFSAYAQWVVVVFMIIGGTSFALHYRGIFNPLQYLRNAEFRLYIGIILVASASVAIGTWGPDSAATTIRNAVFTVSSIMTTTGFATSDFALWVAPLQLLLIGLMFIGAMAGSTSGSVKVFRVGVLWSTMRARLRRVAHPRAVFAIRSGGVPVDDAVARSVLVFAVLYLFLFMTGTILLALICAIGSVELDIISAASAVAACLGNVGPGLELVGPTHNFAFIPAAGKWLLSGLMITGRLEVLPIMLLFTKEFWRH